MPGNFKPKWAPSRAETAKSYNKWARSPAAVEFYRSNDWRKLSLLVRTEEPVCRICEQARTTEADHIIPISLDWSKRFDRDNLRGLCSACHMKVRKEQHE